MAKKRNGSGTKSRRRHHRRHLHLPGFLRFLNSARSFLQTFTRRFADEVVHDDYRRKHGG